MIRDVLSSRWLHFLLLLGVLVPLLAYQWAAPYSIDVGAIKADDDLFIEGFHHRESSPDDDYRWTADRASMAIRGIGRGRSWKLILYLSGYRPPEEPAPRVQLRVNGRDLAAFSAEPEMTEYQFPVDASMIGWGGDLMLEIEPEVFYPEGDPRGLGVLITRITLVPDLGGVVIPSPLTLLIVLGCILTLFGFLKWTGAPDSVSLAANILLLLALGFTVALHRQYAVLYSLLVLILLTGASIAALCLQVSLGSLARRLGWNLIEPARLKTLLGIVFLALACNLALAPTPGFVGDIGIYMTWAWKLTTGGLHSAYLPHDLVEPINYLPFVPYLFSLVGSLYQRFFASTFPFPLAQSTLLFYSMMKLPMIAANIVAGVVIFLFVRRRMSSRLALLALTAYLFNPAILYDSAYGGQADAVHSLFALLAIVLALERHPGTAWFCIALAALSKPQGALFLPLILFLTWRRSGVGAAVKGVLVASIVVFMVFFPFLFRGTWDSVQSYLLSIGRLDIPGLPAYTTMGAHNLWWVLGLGAEVQDLAGPLSQVPVMGQLITARTIGLCLLAFFYVLGLFKLWRSVDDVWVPAVAAFLGFACYMSLTQVHETYAFSVLPLLALILPSERRWRVIYSVLSITFLANMVLHDAALLDMLGLLEYEQLLAPLRYANALTNLAVLIYWTGLLFIDRRSAKVPASPSLERTEAR